MRNRPFNTVSLYDILHGTEKVRKRRVSSPLMQSKQVALWEAVERERINRRGEFHVLDDLYYKYECLYARDGPNDRPYWPRQRWGEY